MRNRTRPRPGCHGRPLRLCKPRSRDGPPHARAKVTKDRTKAAYAKTAEAFTVSTWSGPPAWVARARRGHAMTPDDDLPAEVRRQDEEAELQIAAQLAELRKDEHVNGV